MVTEEQKQVIEKVYEEMVKTGFKNDLLVELGSIAREIHYRKENNQDYDSLLTPPCYLRWCPACGGDILTYSIEIDKKASKLIIQSNETIQESPGINNLPHTRAVALFRIKCHNKCSWNEDFLNYYGYYILDGAGKEEDALKDLKTHPMELEWILAQRRDTTRQ